MNDTTTLDWPEINMYESSTDLSASARKTRQEILRRLQERGRKTETASAMNVAPSTIQRRFTEEKLDEFCVLLDMLGLRVVPADAPVVDPKRYAAIALLAKERLDQIHGDLA